MAIPFNVPSEEQPTESDWVIQFQMIFKRNILNLLNEMAQIRDNSSNPETPNNSSTSASNSGTSLDVNPSSGQNVRTDLDWLTRQSAENERTRLNLHRLLSSTLNNPTASSAHSQIPSTRRPRRQRSSSESSCCEESKNNSGQLNEEEEADIQAEQEWSEVGVFLRKIAGDFPTPSLEVEESSPSRPKHRCKQENSSVFSKFMPTTIKSSIWTAVICVIGWHLFRAR